MLAGDSPQESEEGMIVISLEFWILALVLVLALPAGVWAAELAELKALAERLYQQGRYEAAIPLVQQALALARQQFGEDHPATAKAYNNLAILYQAMGRNAAAEPLSRKAL